MIKFILRRLGISSLVLLGGSVLMFVLTINSGDPLADLRESNDPNRDSLIAQRINNMGLDDPWYERYGAWLAGVGRCVVGSCDLGVNRAGIPVIDLLGNAAAATLRLVILSTLLAIVIGIGIGILTAIRQYSGFDYIVTFFAFMMYSLPVFWAAVLLKEYGAIRFNDWIVSPDLALWQIALVALVLAVVIAGALGGDARRRLLTGGATFLFVFAAMFYFDAVDWYRQPALGIGVVAVASIGAALLIVMLSSGLGNKNVLYAALTTVGAGIVSYFVFSSQLGEPTWGVLFGLFAVAIVIAVLSGALWGGYSRTMAIWVSVATATVMSLVIVVDQALSAWAGYLGSVRNGRPISTIGAETPNYDGTFWQEFLDKGTQLLLPTILLTLVSVASYSRYTRSSMLEVLEQDYVRTARSKGLSERVVITKHAFRNALIPITTIVAFDFAGLIGGAVLTETVFGWKGMGELFRTGLVQVDPAPVMAFFLVTGTAAVVMNMLADIAYAFLDPRIRR
ncbi:peptide/nickel transport system permease protein [Georgenia satyanarayanai]|uniref:Peptide/nickel transport system permease protein n=1 Tax=Georgenia satyanarayanai TaxID=860221 RepID=A0A2Y9AV73_9MICO|nr:ABC transporter permease [Georgenia satyanarayanai]PYF96821.1 peptide/nickel transport system permease protein [Georgenia satyanarayanai]SSA46417.1 peptide/nickel transport system permease protein [Georgenia satyanarayanai]